MVLLAFLARKPGMKVSQKVYIEGAAHVTKGLHKFSIDISIAYRYGMNGISVSFR